MVEASDAEELKFDATEKALLERFLFLSPTDFFDSLDSAISRLAPPLSEAATVFRDNLSSAIAVGSIPFAMARAAVVSRRFQAIHSAERIRALADVKAGEDLTPELQRRAYERASKRMDQECASPNGRNRSVKETMSELGGALTDSDFDTAASELLRQTLVMVWGAFEVFITDAVIGLVNERPELAMALLASEQTRRHFPSRGVPIDALAKYEFNVARSMGIVLSEERQFDSLPVIRDVLSIALPGKVELRRRLADESLWTLWQRRHLIVHRRGIVDHAYVSKTPDTARIGSRLEVTSTQIDSSLSLVRDTAISFIDAVSPCTLGSGTLG